jgi:carboxypeptidase Taq
MGKTKDLYSQLLDFSRMTSLLASVESLLDWDQETYMPKEAIHFRSIQIEMLASLVHKNRTSKTFSKLLNQLIDIRTGEIKDSSLSSSKVRALKEWRRDYIKAIKLPNAFVKQFAKTTSTAVHAWKSARHHNDFREFLPHLEKVVSLCRKKADILGFQEHPYDALLDLYEPGMKTSILTSLFCKLKLQLTQILKGISGSPSIPHEFLRCRCPKYKQLAFSHLILKTMGFHENTSRIDQSAHPFCSPLLPNDIRMTTRFNPEDPFFSIFAVLHEGGHGLYALGRPKEEFGSPLSESLSLGIDESQSRWWETLIGQSFSFWEYFFPLLQKEFSEHFHSIHLDEFYRAINHIKPSLIRIEADEITYNLHILLRFEIEKGLIEGSLKTSDIPDVWNEKMRNYLGISPEFDGEGCLQDIHWSLGLFGYFPTYTLGNLYASQFFEIFEKSFPYWQERVAKGELGFIREWLRENIHQYGRQFSPTELCMNITGKSLSEEAFIKYLNTKYKNLYHLEPIA